MGKAQAEDKSTAKELGGKSYMYIEGKISEKNND
jgi:hypothetical protein